jgi:hypothetical protein
MNCQVPGRPCETGRRDDGVDALLGNEATDVGDDPVGGVAVVQDDRVELAPLDPARLVDLVDGQLDACLQTLPGNRRGGRSTAGSRRS